MTDNHNFLALDWVKSEIEETLKQAQQALEAYIVTPSDTAKLRFCLAYLHQVFGTCLLILSVCRLLKKIPPLFCYPLLMSYGWLMKKIQFRS